MAQVLLLVNPEDQEYTHLLKSAFRGQTPYIACKEVEYLHDIVKACKSAGIKSVVTTQKNIVKKLLAAEGNIKANISLDDYAGSMWTYQDIDFLCINPLKQLFTVPYGKFMAHRYISKIVAPEEWYEPTDFSFTVANASNIQEFYDRWHHAALIGVDIETLKQNLVIRCIGYTAAFIEADGTIRTESLVIKLGDRWALTWMRKFNALPVKKVTQNGKYDCSYLLRFNAPITYWLCDTAHFMHAMYSELPKDLAFLNAFFLRKVVYWKDLAESPDEYTYFRYNALDTWATVNVFIIQLLSAKDYARRNYLLEFPLVYPCLLSECTGILRDEQRKVQANKEVDFLVEKSYKSIRYITGSPGFNANSYVQVRKLLHVLTGYEHTASDEKYLAKIQYAHPFNHKILQVVLDIRGNIKLKGTYLKLGEDSEDYRGTFFYSLNPHYTDTGRLASGESAFWCGQNVQNIPGGPTVKQTLRCPDGFFIAEADLEQAESRDTGYITGDAAIISAVSGSRDFHSVNTSNMSGIAYEDIYDDRRKKPKNKPLRDGFKRVNHGGNYNMGPGVLIDTLGLPLIFKIRDTLKLPFKFPEEVTEYCLIKFHQTFTRLKGITKIRSDKVRRFCGLPQSDYKLYCPGTYYEAIAEEVKHTGRITSRAYHHTEYNARKHPDVDKYIREGDWTRVCFNKPWESKLALNAYVAHPPQSLNARTLNEAYMDVFYKIALPYAKHFRLYAQIHDSILHAYRQGWEWLSDEVKKCMEIPVTVRDVFGETRTFTVPAALKQGKYVYDSLGNPVVDDYGNHHLIRAIYWSETE